CARDRIALRRARARVDEVETRARGGVAEAVRVARRPVAHRERELGAIVELERAADVPAFARRSADQRDAALLAAAVERTVVLRLERYAVDVAPRDDVDDAGECIRAVDRRSAV